MGAAGCFARANDESIADQGQSRPCPDPLGRRGGRASRTSPDTALSLASAVAGTAGRARARRLEIAEEGDKAKAKGRADTTPAKPQDAAYLLGRTTRLTHDENRVVLAEGGGKPATAAPVLAYGIKAFGEHLSEVKKAMKALAARYEPDELNRVGFHLYEPFRPDVPADVRGWGAKGVLDLNRIMDADEEDR